MKKVYISLVAVFLYCTASAQIIVIDPGHGYGATVSNNPDGRTATEIETALEVGIRTKNLIKNSTCAWTVHLTRTTNINGWVSVDQRALMAQNWNADRLLSIHGNAGGGSGTETFYSTATGLTANTQSAAVQLAYATKVQNNMVTEGAWINRRISTDIAYLGYNLGVLKRSTTACLNEIGFVDNATDKPKLLSTVWRDKFALAYFKAFQADLKVTCNTAVTPGAFNLTTTPECNGAASQIRLNWTASANATAYDIYRNGALYSSNITSTQFINTAVTSGTSYTYYVKAKNGASQVNNANGTLSATAVNCSTPGSFNLTLTPECTGIDNQIKLTWTASANATSYDVYRNGTLYTSGITGLQYINTLVTASTSYSYYVKAVNTLAQTTNSNGSLSATALNCGMPGSFALAVTPQCVAGENEIKLTWDASANATSYDVYRNGTLYSSGLTTTQYINYVVTAGTNYSYLVKANNSLGTVNNSNGTLSALAPSCAARLGAFNNLGSEIINEVKLFPNPASTNFSLLIGNMLNQTLEINIFNINGQNVYSSNTISYDDTFNGNINIEHLSNGIYFVKLSFNGTEQNHKLIKE